MRRGVCAGHWQGSKKGSWARGRASWPRNPATCVSAGKAELTRQAHGTEREKGTHGATARQLANRARETESERERAGEGNWRRQVGPTEQRAREGGCA
jgi:hypothetical protein